MAVYRNRRICVRLTEDEYNAALLVAQARQKYSLSSATISRLVVSLIRQAIKDHTAEQLAKDPKTADYVKKIWEWGQRQSPKV